MYVVTEKLDHIRPDGVMIFKREDHGYFFEGFDLIEWAKVRYPGEIVRLITSDTEPESVLDKLK